MPDGGATCTADTLRELSRTVTAAPHAVPERLSALLAPFAPHGALVILTSDVDGGRRRGTGDDAFVRGVSYLDLDERRRLIRPGRIRRDAMEGREILLVVSQNGALLVLADAAPDPHGERVVLDLWNIVSLRIQEIADTAAPDYLRRARHSSGERMEALAELGAEYSTTLETVLASLRSPRLEDQAARHAATAIAAEGLVHLRTASDRARTVTEEPVTTAFERLREDLRPLMRFRDIDVQFVEPPVDGRPLPSEVAHGARAVVRGAILVMIDDPAVTRVRAQWDCDGTNLIIGMRDDGDGSLSADSSQLRLVGDRIHALRGRISVDATPGWGTEMHVVVPLDPPQAHGVVPDSWSLGKREEEVFARLAAGAHNRGIAADLNISQNTVKFHVANLYRKLGVSNRAEATALYLSHT